MSKETESVGEDMVDTFIPLIEELTDSVDESSRSIVDAIGKININPQVIVNVPEIKLPTFTVPDIHIPEIKLPVFNVPESRVVVEIPPIKVPTPQVTVNVPKADAPIVNIPEMVFPSSMGVTASFKDPLPVILTDRGGKPYTAEQILQTGGGGFKIVTIGDIKASAFTSFQNGDGRLRVSIESGGGTLTDTELRAASVLVSQASGSIWSTEVTNTVPVSVANTLDVKQVSGSVDSVSVIGTVAVSLAVAPTTPVTGTFWQATQPVSSADTLDVRQVSGVSWSTNVLTMPTILVSDITASLKAALVDSSGAQYSGSNPVPIGGAVTQSGTWNVGTVTTVTGITNSLAMVNLDRDGNPWAPYTFGQGDSATALRVLHAGDAISSVFVTGAFDSMMTYMARTTNPTAKADGADVRPMTDKMGRQAVVPYHVRDMVGTAHVLLATSLGYNTETTLIAIGAAGVSNDIIMISASNDSTVAAVFDFRCGTGNAAISKRIVIPPNGIIHEDFNVPYPGEINTPWTVKNAVAVLDTTGNNVSIQALFVKNT